MSDASDRELVSAALFSATKRTTPFDVQRFARVMRIPIQAIPIDLVIAQSREIDFKGTAVKYSAQIICESPDFMFWLSELISVGEITKGVAAIAVEVCSSKQMIHPLASLNSNTIVGAKTLYDVHVQHEMIFSHHLSRNGNGATRVVFLDQAHPLESWIDARVNSEEPEGFRGAIELSGVAASGLFADALSPIPASNVGSEVPVYIGAAAAIFLREPSAGDASSTRDDEWI